MQHLRESFGLTWPDGQWNRIWQARPARAVGGVVRRRVPGMQGCLAAFYATGRLRGTDVVLSVFENVGLGFARWQGMLPPAQRVVPHLMVTCWLAEECQRMSSRQLVSVRRSLQSVSKLVVFSANQAAILEEFFALGPGRVGVVSFGVDTQYYDPSAVSGPGGGGGVVAVGGDARRDYATLAAAADILGDVPITLACYPRNLVGVQMPPQVRIVSGVYNAEYRKLLHSADLVVTPTAAPAYPSGQSVVLEAMSMARPTLTTDSPAMRDYVDDGINGALVPPREPAAMARLIAALLADNARRQALGTAAARSVRDRFSAGRMWQSIAELMTAASQGRRAAPPVPRGRRAGDRMAGRRV
jgi:glycosyltransferase involved in cell wall biosynthesis